MKRTVCSLSLVVAFSLSFLIVVQISSADVAPAPEPLTLDQVALFKNGLGFFVGRVVCPPEKASFDVALPSAPSHGTFWVSYPPDVSLASIVASQIDSARTLEATTIPEILMANPGKRVTLLVGDRRVDGIIKHVSQGRDSVRPNPYEPGGRAIDGSEPPRWSPNGLLVLETGSAELSLDVGSVTEVTFEGEKANRRFVENGKSPALRVRLRRPAGERQLTVSYLAKGITWAPSYVVDLTNGDKARLSAKALIVNDACELKSVEVKLVTGFPHLQFADTFSPIGLQEDLARFLQALARGESERGRADVMSNVMSQRVAYGGGGMGGMSAEAAMPAYGAAEAGQVAEDLFLYPAGAIDMGREEVAYIPLFTETAPSRHIYQWEIPDYVNEGGPLPYARSPRDGGQEERQQVWHSIRLTNSTKVPWTTAPAETVKNGVILGQDTLGYTPPGAEATLRITQAVGIKAEQREFEMDRKREAAQLYGYHYDLVTVKGELSIMNLQDKAVQLEITKNLSGEYKSGEPAPEMEKLATGLRRMNGLLKLTWTLNVKPEERRDLSYVYDVYVRR